MADYEEKQEEKPLAVVPGTPDPNAFVKVDAPVEHSVDPAAEPTTESQRNFVKQAVEEAKAKVAKAEDKKK